MHSRNNKQTKQKALCNLLDNTKTLSLSILKDFYYLFIINYLVFTVKKTPSDDDSVRA